MNKYRKLIAAVVGLVVLWAGVEIAPDQQQMIVQVVLSLLTALGVWAVPNED